MIRLPDEHGSGMRRAALRLVFLLLLVAFSLAACSGGNDLPEPLILVTLYLMGKYPWLKGVPPMALALLIVLLSFHGTHTAGLLFGFGLVGLSLYAAPSVVRTFYKRSMSPYSEALLYAFCSGVLMGVWSAIFHAFGESLPPSVEVGVFGFIMFFVINCGHIAFDSAVSDIFSKKDLSDWKFLPAGKDDPSQERIVRRLAIIDHLQYLNFIVAPVAGWLSSFAWPIGTKETSRLAVAILVFFVATISIGALLKSSYLAFDDGATVPDVDRNMLFEITSDLRTALFWGLIHDLIVAAMLSVVVLKLGTNWNLALVVVGTGAVVLSVSTACGLVPFMMAQSATVRAMTYHERPYSTRKTAQAELWKLRPPWPASRPPMLLVVAAATCVTLVAILRML